MAGLEAGPGRQIRRSVLWLLRVGVGVLFIIAGAMKLRDIAGFIVVVHHYKLLPGRLVGPVAVYLPWLEIIGGLAVCCVRRSRGPVLVLTLLMAIFLATILVAWARGLDIACGCFGSGAEHIRYPFLVLRDVGILSILVMLLVTPAEK